MAPIVPVAAAKIGLGAPWVVLGQLLEHAGFEEEKRVVVRCALPRWGRVYIGLSSQV